MTEAPKGDELLKSLLDTPTSTHGTLPTPSFPASNGSDDEDVDALIDELEALFTEAKRVPFGKKLMVDEERALAVIDRLRTAVPNEVKQAHRVLDEQEQLLEDARIQARKMLEERGLMDQLETERERAMARIDAEAQRIRADADRYVRNVLQELNERLIKVQTSVQNGLDTLDTE